MLIIFLFSVLEPSMKGFLQDYAFLHFKPSHDEKARKDLLQSYMSVFSPSLTPVTHALAEKYAICDEVISKASLFVFSTTFFLCLVVRFSSNSNLAK